MGLGRVELPTSRLSVPSLESAQCALTKANELPLRHACPPLSQGARGGDCGVNPRSANGIGCADPAENAFAGFKTLVKHESNFGVSAGVLSHPGFLQKYQTAAQRISASFERRRRRRKNRGVMESPDCPRAPPKPADSAPRFALAHRPDLLEHLAALVLAAALAEVRQWR
jgi:hypothetical protein